MTDKNSSPENTGEHREGQQLVLSGHVNRYIKHLCTKPEERKDDFGATADELYQNALMAVRDIMDDAAYDPVKVAVVYAADGGKAEPDNLCLHANKMELPSHAYANGWFEGKLFELSYSPLAGEFRFGNTPFIDGDYKKCELLSPEEQERLKLIWIKQGL